MADARDDGGQAFPGVQTDGMSLRDYFAGQAVAGLCATARLSEIERRAYAIADAMLAERSK